MKRIEKARDALDAIAKAKAKLSDLCHGRERWHMSIPADPDNDPDIVIMDGLHKAEEALAALEAEEPEESCTGCWLEAEKHSACDFCKRNHSDLYMTENEVNRIDTAAPKKE